MIRGHTRRKAVRLRDGFAVRVWIVCLRCGCGGTAWVPEGADGSNVGGPYMCIFVYPVGLRSDAINSTAAEGALCRR